MRLSSSSSSSPSSPISLSRLLLLLLSFSLSPSPASSYSFLPFSATHLSRYPSSSSSSSTSLSSSPPNKPKNPGGEGDTEWKAALAESTTQAPGEGEKQMKMQGLLGGPADSGNKRASNAALLKWLTDAGVYLSDASDWGTAPHPLAVSTETVDEATNESTGRGLLARRSISDGDELIAIPVTMTMNKDTAIEAVNNPKGLNLKSGLVDANGRPPLPGTINEYLAIATMLIYEKFSIPEQQGSQPSYWKPYLDVLPTTAEVGPTFTWSDDDLSALEGSPVISATQSMKIKLTKELEALVLHPTTGLIARFPGHFTPSAFSYDNWLWAFTMLFSRAIRLRSLAAGESIALVPYADLINHSPFSGAFVDAREEGDWIFKTGKEEVVLYADRGFRKMEQVYISYGQKSNADLLLLYGFALERNPFNSVDVTVSISEEGDSSANDGGSDDALFEQKLEFLRRSGRETMVDFPCYADRYPMEMLEYLRLMQMTVEDAGSSPVDSFDYSRAISSANEAAVLNSVIDAIEGQLEKYPTTEDEDVALISDKLMFGILTKNQRMAVRHRRNEKRLLKRTVAALEKEIRNRGLGEAGLLKRAEGDAGGAGLEGDDRKYGKFGGKTALERRLEKMGLPVDLR